MEAGELARTLVQALGLESELSEAEIAGDDTQPFIDLLLENYGVDVAEIVNSSDLASTALGSLPTPATPTNSAVAVSQRSLIAVLEALVGAAADPHPSDNIIVTVERAFTVQLSDGRLLAVTLNNRSDAAIVRLVNTASGTVIAGDEIVGDSDDFIIPQDIINAIGRATGGTTRLSSSQATNLANAIRQLNPGIAVVNVPTNTITVSPSS